MKWLNKISKEVWLWLVPLINLFDVLCFKIPLFTYCLFVFEAFVYYTDFYAKYYPTLNNLDTILIGLMLFHSFIMFRLIKYNFVQLSLYICILLVVGLNIEVSYFPMQPERYIFFYRLILLLTIIVVFLNKFFDRNENNKRHLKKQ